LKDKNLVKTGAAGAVVLGVCCFTPLLVVGLGAIGLSAWLAWADYILLPGLVIFLGLTGYGLWRLKSN